MKELFKYTEILIRDRKTFIKQCYLGVLVQLLAIVLMSRISVMTDATINANMDRFVEILVEVAFVIILQIVVFFWMKKCDMKTAVLCGMDLRNKTYHHIICNTKNNEGKILNLYNSQFELIEGLVRQYADTIISFLSVIMAGCYMASISLNLLLVSVVLIPASGVAYNYFLKPLQEKNKIIIKEKEQLNIKMKEIMDGFYIVKSYLLEKAFQKQFNEISENIGNIEREKDKTASIVGRITIVLRYIPQLIIPLYGGWLCYAGNLSVGELVAANTAIWYVIIPIEKILKVKKDVKELQPVLDEVIKIWNEDKMQYCGNGDTNTKIKTDNMVDITNLSFQYEDGKEIFTNLNLKVQAAEHAVIFGKSGIGKSTFIKIICGLEKAFCGEVWINGVNVQDNGTLSILDFISYVPQKPYIFSGTILENICMGNEANKEQIEKALEITELETFIESLVQGTETLVGEGGVRLSGGEQKRIAIARAIIADSALCILDEPTSSLDKKTRERVMEKLMLHWRDKTVLMISHNREDITYVNQVYTLERGILLHE